MKSSKKYWHEMSDEQWEEIHKPGYTWGKAREKYTQPAWCHYLDAIHPLGCWSLIDKELRKTISRKFCKSCDEYKEE